ncbi:MAG: hypothetical protein GY729_10760, partial [Desulfobacteraceae bacterium]|nr:hypothetical protein [Desulfobacteraceae bacterium]
ISQITLSSKLAGQKIHFDMNSASEFANITIKGFFNPFLPGFPIDASLDADAELIDLLMFTNQETVVDGALGLNLSIKGLLNNPEAKIDLNVTDLALDEFGQKGDINFSAKLLEKKASITQGHFLILENNISIGGLCDFTQMFPKGFLHSDINTDQLSYKLFFQQTNGDLKNLNRFFKGISGKFSSSGQIKGRGVILDEMSADFDIKVNLESVAKSNLKQDALELETVIKGKVENSLARISDGFIRNKEQTLVKMSAACDLIQKKVDADINVAAPDLETLFLPFGIKGFQGRLNSNITISGPLTGPAVTGRANSKSLRLLGLNLSDVSFEGELNQSGIASIKKMVAVDAGMMFELK